MRAGADTPVGGRVCQTGQRQAPEVTETIVEYHDTADDTTDRTLTYQATAGMPAFTAEVAVRGLLGRLAWWLLLFTVRRTGRHLLADLKHYVEHGTPSPRKQRQLAGRRRPA